ncbi:MAG: glycerophosphodiester phosphodiesterase [Cellulosilyticum sp.]|nr:glycerophosphodiester phosphodiesterase [Cellulosilyticum sp.]
MNRVLNIAHRGFSGKYPENTNIAFAKALTEGYCDGIEVDVHMTKDNKVVIIHDTKLDRTTTGTGYIKDYTLDELLEFDAGVKYDEKYKGEKILCIKSAMELVKKYNVRLYVEIKDDEIDYKDIEAEVLDRVEIVGVEDKVILSSYNIETLKRIKAHKPDIQTALLTKEVTFDIRAYQYADILSCDYTKLSKEVVDTIHSIGRKVTAWVVDDKAAMREMKDMGVDAVITNYPDEFSDVINGL